MVTKKKDGKEVEEQEGWKGRVVPFELVQRIHHKQELDALQQKQIRVAEIASFITQIIESLSEDEGEYDVLNEAGDKFVVSELNKVLNDQLLSAETDETRALNNYLDLLEKKAKKPEKASFIAEHHEVYWSQIEASKDGTYSKGNVNTYLTSLRSAYYFPEDSFAHKLLKASTLLEEEKALKTAIKNDGAALHLKTKSTIESLRDDQVKDLLEAKWVVPLNEALHQLPDQQIELLIGKLQSLVRKYEVTYANNAHAIQQTEMELAEMIDELRGDEFDIQGLTELKSLLEAHKNVEKN
jgi:type I restriction enzyme M protein